MVASTVTNNQELILYYQTHPVEFCRDVISFEPTDQQIQLIFAINNPGAWVSTKSGHGTGKTSTIACLGLWFISVFADAKVPVTHPSKEQLKSTLWPEIRKWHNRMIPSFRDELEINSEKVFVKKRPDTFIQARTAKQDNPDALQGFHAEHLLFLIDEASGVAAKIFEVALGALTTTDTRFFLTGNPTQTSGFFYDTFHKKGARDLWIKFTLSCLDSPNVAPDYAGKMAQQFGADSNEYRVRVLGEFPDSSNSQFIPNSLVDEAIARYEEVSLRPDSYNEAPVILGVDVARFGDDSSCVFLRQGIYSQQLYLIKDIDTYTLAEIVVDLAITFKADSVCVDVGGIGAGVFDYVFRKLTPKGISVIDVNFGSRAEEKDVYYLKRSELYGRGRTWLRQGGALPPDEDLKEELCAVEYEFTSSEQTAIVRKDVTKKIICRSPDKADALVLTFADPYCVKVDRDGIRGNGNSVIITSNDKDLFGD